MDLVDQMLIRVGDYTSDIQHYSTLRRRLRREYGGINRNPVLLMLEETIEAHLQMADKAMLKENTSTDMDWEFVNGYCVDQIDEPLFDAGRKVCGNNLISDILLHAAYLKYFGKCATMFDEFKEQVLETAEAM